LDLSCKQEQHGQFSSLRGQHLIQEIFENYKTMPDITVTCESIAKLLNLNPNKGAGPDDFF
jgi:hypothetical protein